MKQKENDTIFASSTQFKSAIKIKAKAIWMQDGVRNDEAHNLARNNGLLVVMNDCILRKHHKTLSHF